MSLTSSLQSCGIHWTCVFVIGLECQSRWAVMRVDANTHLLRTIAISFCEYLLFSTDRQHVTMICQARLLPVHPWP